MQKIKHSIIAFIALFTLATGASFVMPQIASAASPQTTVAATGCVGGAVLTFPCWYRGLARDSTNTPRLTKLNDLWIIALNVVEILLQLVAYFAAGYIIWGGFKYMKSQGNPQNIASAKSTIMNSAIGLGVAIASVAIVNFVAASIIAG